MIKNNSQTYQSQRHSVSMKKNNTFDYNDTQSHLPIFKRIGKVKKIQSYSLHVSKVDRKQQPRISYNERTFPLISRILGAERRGTKLGREKIKRLGKNTPCHPFVYELWEVSNNNVIEDANDKNQVKKVLQIEEQIEAEIEIGSNLSTEKTFIKEEIMENKIDQKERINLAEENKKQQKNSVKEFQQQNGEVFNIVISKALEDSEGMKQNFKREDKRYSEDIKFLDNKLRSDSIRSSNASDKSDKSKPQKKCHFLLRSNLSFSSVGNEALINMNDNLKLSPPNQRRGSKRKKQKSPTQKPHIVFKSHPYLDRKMISKKKPSFLASRQTPNEFKNQSKPPTYERKENKRQSNISNISSFSNFLKKHC